MPRRNSYTPAQLAWLAERSGTMLRAELTEAFNRRFGQNRSVKAITSTIKREKLPQRAPGYPKGHNITLFSPAQIEFIRTAYRSMDRGEVLRILNTWWDADFTDAQLVVTRQARFDGIAGALATTGIAHGRPGGLIGVFRTHPQAPCRCFGPV